jgi:hypothetical protein
MSELMTIAEVKEQLGFDCIEQRLVELEAGNLALSDENKKLRGKSRRWKNQSPRPRQSQSNAVSLRSRPRMRHCVPGSSPSSRN